MNKRYEMTCPVHERTLETVGIKRIAFNTSAGYKIYIGPVFICPICGDAYIHIGGIKYGVIERMSLTKKYEKYVLYCTKRPVVCKQDPSYKPIWRAMTEEEIETEKNNRKKKMEEEQAKRQIEENRLTQMRMQRLKDNAPGGQTKEVRIRLFKKNEIDQRLTTILSHLQIEYPSFSNIPDVNELIRKIFPSNIDQHCVVRNASFMGNNGHLIKRVDIYNSNSSFLKNRLPQNTYVLFSGRLSNGEFVVDDIRIVENPIIKKDDSTHIYTFLYDGAGHANALYNVTEDSAERPEEIKGELADWNNYLDWKRQLAEMRIQGVKYIGLKINIEERNMSFLVVTEGDEMYKKFKRALRRNEVSVFPNVYSSNQWMFSLNRNEADYRNEMGIELVFIGEGEQYKKEEIDGSWNLLRDYFKKYPTSDESPDLSYLLGGISRNYFEPRYIEVIFELSNSALEVIERHLRRNGILPEDIVETLAGEFYGDGYLATSQVGDFALLRRLKGAVLDLAKGKAASQGLDRWLFDITKARTPQKLEMVESWQNTNINEKQKRAVEKILSTPDVCLIQGPPGTGKTTVIAEAIYQTVIRNKRVLVASQANLAVDNALERLITNPKIRAIRLGSAKKIDSSVNNITEAHVLESFYESIVDYLDSKYLDKWRESDAIIEACNTDYARVEKIEAEINKLADTITAIEVQIERLNSEWDTDVQYAKLNELKMEKVSLSMLKAYMMSGVDDLDIALTKDAIEMLWNQMYPMILALQKEGIWLTRVGIDVNKLNTITECGKANEIIKHIILNLQRVLKLFDKLSTEAEFGGDAEELELLKIKEANLKEKVLKDMDPATMLEWKAINEQIAKLSTDGAFLSDVEKQLFGQDVLEREEIVSDRNIIRKILISAIELINQFRSVILLAVEELIQELSDRQELFQKECTQINEKLMSLEEERLLIEARKLKDEEMIQMILRKYSADRTNLTLKIAERKALVDDNTGIERNEWEDIFEKFVEWVDDIPDYAQEKDLFLKTFINGCNVVGVSCTENARTLNEAGFDDFDLVIIDEVSKATPPELLIPMLRGRKIVLVGDHRQLPPLFNEHEKTYQEVAQQQEDIIKANDGEDNMIIELTMADFNKYKDMVTASLFEKYFENATEDIKETLTYQYRMHKDIMDIVNIFYDGYLQDGNEKKYELGCKNHDLNIQSTSGTSMIIPSRHAYWFDSSMLDGVEIYEQRKPGSTSAENLLEAYTIVELLKKMEIEYANQRHEKTPVSVGVISFYYDQVSTLRAMVRKETFHAIDVEINTVDRFQGKEKEIILVSLVRNVKNAKHRTDSHIAAFQRINVAFSRAQNLLIIVGAKDMYAPQPVILTDMNNGQEKEVMVYKNIIEMLDMRGALFSCDEVLSENITSDIFENLSKKGDIEA